MATSYYRYPWRISFDDLVEETPKDLPVASGACSVIHGDDAAHSNWPSRRAWVADEYVWVCELPDIDEQTRRSMVAAGQDSASELNELISESLRYIQRVEDITASENPPGSYAGKPWNALLEELAQTDWRADLVRKPLIVQLAEQQGYPLKEIDRGAKRILRRIRDKERVSQAREFDKASLIRIAQLPGRTLAEKAGPRQRIPAVKRYETTDTLENRVVEHFCRLVEGEWRRIEQREKTRIGGDHRLVVESFERLCRRTRTGDDFRDIAKLRTPCISPNFTLEQNVNYRAIWVGYKRLIQRQTEEEKCRAWVRRLFLNRTLVFAAELFEQAFPAKEARYVPFAKHSRWRSSQVHGLWLDADSLPAPRVFSAKGGGDLATVYFLSPHDVQKRPDTLRFLGLLNADGYYVAVSDQGLRVSPFYSFVGDSSPGALGKARDDLQQVHRRLQKRGMGRTSIRAQLCAPVLVWADFLHPDVSLPELDDSMMTGGVPVINGEWKSPSARLVQALNQALLA